MTRIQSLNTADSELRLRPVATQIASLALRTLGFLLVFALFSFGSPSARAAGMVRLFTSQAYVARNYQVENYQDQLSLQPGQERLPLVLNIYNGSNETPGFKWFRLTIGGYLIATEQSLSNKEFGSLDVTGKIPGGQTQVLVEAAGVPGAALRWALTTPRIEITSIEPGTIEPGQTLTIRGANFSPVPGQNTVTFGDQTGEVIASDPSTLKVKVPENVQSGIAQLQVNVDNNRSRVTEVMLTGLPAPELLSIDCWMAPPGGTITITGRNFSADAGLNKVFFRDVEARVVSASPTQLVVEVPNWSYGPQQLNIPLSVVSNGVTSANSLPFDIGPMYHGATPQFPTD